MRSPGCLSKTIHAYQPWGSDRGWRRCSWCMVTVDGRTFDNTLRFRSSRRLYERQTSACLIREAGVSEASANLVYACDQWEIDLGRRELRSRGIPVPLGGRAFEVITVLVQSASEFVTKDHLMERVWPGPPVSHATSPLPISAS